VGYTLDELTNEITGATPASFEPSIDYVVTKIPRFAFEKFKGAEPLLSTAMKSVGEVMAIGRNIKESMQKALRGLETGLDGFNRVDELVGASATRSPPPSRAPRPTACWSWPGLPRRLFGRGHPRDHPLRPWFLRHIEEIIAEEANIECNGLPTDAAGMRRSRRWASRTSAWPSWR
jgi:carbamoyl-phosphate synthase large subunit